MARARVRMHEQASWPQTASILAMLYSINRSKGSPARTAKDFMPKGLEDDDEREPDQPVQVPFRSMGRLLGVIKSKPRRRRPKEG